MFKKFFEVQISNKLKFPCKNLRKNVFWKIKNAKNEKMQNFYKKRKLKKVKNKKFVEKSKKSKKWSEKLQ